MGPGSTGGAPGSAEPLRRPLALSFLGPSWRAGAIVHGGSWAFTGGAYGTPPADSGIFQDRGADVRSGTDPRATDGTPAAAHAWNWGSLWRHRVVREDRRSASRPAQCPGSGPLRRAVLNGHPP